MKFAACAGAFALAGLLTTSAVAGDLKSGLQAGDPVDAFDVTKLGGAVDDGVKDGQTLCYR